MTSRVDALVDEGWMQQALLLAAEAERQGEVPVGAVLVHDDNIIGRGFNAPISTADPSAHAEIVALRDAAQRQGNYRLPGATLYVTIEPCSMCVGAMIHARISRLVFGASEPKAGAVISQLELLDAGFMNHRIDWSGGVMAEQCAALMRDFFRAKRARPNV